MTLGAVAQKGSTKKPDKTIIKNPSFYFIKQVNEIDDLSDF